ncbi:Mlo-related protein [Parasponia andersonii]|uniref:Mlo-related protein n=1 Tax=Parasponia andersonii TaxID=3476 RepID=A0A2P5CTJ7_PARAD|nr:Mlo-related protein [Parasponia andersonii]
MLSVSDLRSSNCFRLFDFLIKSYSLISFQPDLQAHFSRVGVLCLCSYITLPLYAPVTQVPF